MLDKSLIGRESETTVVEVEKGAIRRFAEAIGDANPIYADEAAARAAGMSFYFVKPVSPGKLAQALASIARA